MKTIKLILAAIILLANLSYAQMHPNKKPYFPNKPNLGLFKDLNLTEEQKDKFGEIKDESSLKIFDLEYKIKKLKIELNKYMRHEDFDNAKITLNKISDLKKQIEEIRFEEKIKIYSILDKEQKDKIKEFLLNHH